jgi:putative MATE family efflux protein
LSTARAKTTQYILDAPVGKVLWRLATPNVLAVAMTTGITFADAWFIGQLGTAALASLALVFPFLTLMQMMAGGAIGGGTTSAVARAFGAGDQAKAESIAWHALLIAVSISCFFTVVLGVFSRPIFQLLGGQGEALAGAVAYSRIVFGGAAATWLIFVMSAVFRGTGDTVTPARAIISAALVQIPMSGALTLGWFGLPSLGVMGPATAWVICQGTGAAYLILTLLSGKARLRMRPQAFSWAPFKDIMKVGGLGLLNSLCIAMTVVVMTGFVGRYGTAALAGYGLGARLELMLVPMAFGIGGALTATVGVNVGAGQFARARRFAWIGAGMTMIGTGIIGLTAALMPNLWLDMFTADPDAYRFGVKYLVIAALFYGVFGAGQALYFASQGTGKMVLPVSVTALRFLTVTAMGSIVIFNNLDISRLFIAVAIGLTIMGVGQAFCVFGPAWREAHSLKRQEMATTPEPVAALPRKRT